MPDEPTAATDQEIPDATEFIAALETTKKPWESKSILLGLLGLLGSLIPGLAPWVRAHPAVAVPIASALLVLWRLKFGQPISLRGGSVTPVATAVVKAGTTLAVLLMAGSLLSSCSQSALSGLQSIPFHATVRTPDGTYSYSSKGGLSAEIDARGK